MLSRSTARPASRLTFRPCGSPYILMLAMASSVAACTETPLDPPPSAATLRPTEPLAALVADKPCTFTSIRVNASSFSKDGGNLVVIVAGGGRGTCPTYKLDVGKASWLQPRGGREWRQLGGETKINVSVNPNTGSTRSRSASVSIVKRVGSRTSVVKRLTIRQDGRPVERPANCTFMLESELLEFPVGGGTDSVSVTVSDNRCSGYSPIQEQGGVGDVEGMASYSLSPANSQNRWIRVTVPPNGSLGPRAASATMGGVGNGVSSTSSRVLIMQRGPDTPVNANGIDVPHAVEISLESQLFALQLKAAPSLCVDLGITPVVSSYGGVYYTSSQARRVCGTQPISFSAAFNATGKLQRSIAWFMGAGSNVPRAYTIISQRPTP